MKNTSKHIIIGSLFFICATITILLIDHESTYAMPLFIAPQTIQGAPSKPIATRAPTPDPKRTKVVSKQRVTPKPIAPISNDNLIVLINAKRSENNVGTLSPNAKLMQSAQAKANDMCSKNYWSHDTPDGKKFTAWIIEAGYMYRHSGENLAKDCNDNRCMYLWINSPTHKEVMLNPNYKEIGVGRCGVYKVTHFGVK